MFRATVTSEESTGAAAHTEPGAGSTRKLRLESRFGLVGYCSLAVAALSVAARLPGFVRDAFWQDEVASARIISEPTPLGMFRHIARSEATPPLWCALGWLTNLRGLSPVLVVRLALKQIPTGAFWRRAHAITSESARSTCAKLLSGEQVASPRRLRHGGAG